VTEKLCDAEDATNYLKFKLS